MQRDQWLRAAYEAFAGQGLSLRLEEGSCPDAGVLYVDVGEGRPDGALAPLTLSVCFLQGETSWEQLAFDVLRVEGTLLTRMSLSAASRMDEVIDYLSPQLALGSLTVDHLQGSVQFRHQIACTKQISQEALLTQLDALLMLVLIYDAVFFPTLLDVAYRDREAMEAVAELADRSQSAARVLAGGSLT